VLDEDVQVVVEARKGTVDLVGELLRGSALAEQADDLEPQVK